MVTCEIFRMPTKIAKVTSEVVSREEAVSRKEDNHCIRERF